MLSGVTEGLAAHLSNALVFTKHSPTRGCVDLVQGEQSLERLFTTRGFTIKHFKRFSYYWET